MLVNEGKFCWEIKVVIFIINLGTKPLTVNIKKSNTRWVNHFLDHVDIIGVSLVYGCQVTKHNTNISKLEIQNSFSLSLGIP